MTLEVGSKWLQLLHDIVPAARNFAVLVNPTSPALAKRKRTICRRQRALSGYSCTCCRPALTVTLTLFLRISTKLRRAGS